MLVNNDFNNGDVISIKLANGDELIAKCIDANEGHVKIERPMVLTINDEGFAMLPWMVLGVSERIVLRREHILALVASKQDSAEQYLQHANKSSDEIEETA
jgi:hypothetical protein